MHRVAGLALSLVLSVAAVATIAWPLPLQREVTLKELIPLTTWQKQFKITEGKDRGKVVPLIMHRVSANQDRRQLSFGDYASILLLNDSDGGLAMERLDLFKSHSYIVYEPALPILPPSLTSGEGTRHQASFKMYDAETGRLKRTGSATHLVKKVAHSRFDTPAGPVDGYYIDIDHQMDMRYAKLQITLGLGCRLDDGPIYGSGHYTLTKLGLFTERKTVSAALLRN
jgi:hypothetical protein